MSQAAEKRGGMPAMLKDTAFVWEDPLDLESELTEEERMVQNSTRGFAQSYLMPRVIEAFRDEQYDPSLLPEMGKLGLLGPTIPEEYGGAGLGYVSYGLITRELERADSGYRSSMSVQSSQRGASSCRASLRRSCSIHNRARATAALTSHILAPC